MKTEKGNMATTAKNKLDYIHRWNADKTKSISIRLHKVNDADLIEVWENIPNKSEWIKEKLREYRDKRGL